MGGNYSLENLTPLARELFPATVEQYALLNEGRERGLIELAPVVLPERPLGDNNHMGWPVGTMTGDTLVVIHRRMPGHDARGPRMPIQRFQWRSVRSIKGEPGANRTICAVR